MKGSRHRQRHKPPLQLLLADSISVGRRGPNEDKADLQGSFEVGQLLRAGHIVACQLSGRGALRRHQQPCSVQLFQYPGLHLGMLRYQVPAREEFRSAAEAKHRAHSWDNLLGKIGIEQQKNSSRHAVCLAHGILMPAVMKR